MIDHYFKSFKIQTNLFSSAVHQSTFLWSEETGVDGAPTHRKGQTTSEIRFWGNFPFYKELLGSKEKEPILQSGEVSYNKTKP